MKQLFYILIFILAFTSCSKEENEELPQNFQGYTYLPLEVGKESVFQIDSVTYDDFTGLIDTTFYFEREVVEGIVEDLTARSVFQLSIYRRNDDTSSWRKIRTEERFRGTYRYEVKRQSIYFIPLVFPPQIESRWNVNGLNAMEAEEYRYQDLHQAFSFQGASYDSTITVLQKDQLSLIGREYAREVYASQKGLVYQEQIEVETDINSGEIVSGFEKRKFLID